MTKDIMPNSAGSFIRIAVVDDDRRLLEVFSSLMKRSYYHTHFFLDGAKALEKILAVKGHYNLVISDICMPGMDGIEFAKRIRAVEPDLPIILMTGDVREEYRSAAAQINRVVFLEKPFPLESTLIDFIPKILRGEF